MKLIYRLSDKQVMGWGTHSAAGEGEGEIDLTAEQFANLNQGYSVAVENDLSLTITEVIKQPTAEDTFKATIKSKGVDNINASDALEWTRLQMKKQGYE